MSRVTLASIRGRACVTRAQNDLRRGAGVRRGPRRKIVPIASAERRRAAGDEKNDDDDDDDDSPLEYDDAFAPTTGGENTNASTRARRGTSATTRAREDATHAAFIAPRVAIGVVGDLAARASRGPSDGFKDVFEFAESLRTSTDVFGDVMRRTEREIDRLEAIGVRATAEARRAARGAVPEEVYEKYLMPAVEYAEDEEQNGVDGSEGGSSVRHDEAFDDAAVNAAADAVAAAMAGADVGGEGSSSASSSSSSASSSSSSSTTMDSSFEDTVEEMAANAIMSSSTMSASYSTPETPYGARAPPVPKNGDAAKATPETPETTPETTPTVESEPKAPEPITSTAAFDATVGYWRKIDAECPNEEPLMDIMDMNIVFRQAAGLLNYLRIERPTPSSWGVASSAGIIQIAETYPIDGTPAATPRRDLRAGDQTGVVTALDEDVVQLVISWSDDLPGSQTETFRVDDAGVLVREVNIALRNGDSWSGVYRYRRA